MIDLTNGKLDEALKFAKTQGDDSLQKCIDRLKQIDANYKENYKEVDTVITNDFAPYSFEFSRRIIENGEFAGNGGIIYHGPYDGHGSGQAPTFSASLIPVTGWSIHT